MKKAGKYILCIGVGIFLYFLTGIVDSEKGMVENGVLKRNPCGKGDRLYEFCVENAGEERLEFSLSIPEQMPSAEEFHRFIPAVAELLSKRILGNNPSLNEVREDLELVREIPEYGITVMWESKEPDILSSMGVVNSKGVQENGKKVLLEAHFSCGKEEELIKFPVTIFPEKKEGKKELQELLEQLAQSEREKEEVILPKEFHGNSLIYQKKDQAERFMLVLLGVGAAFCLRIKEIHDLQEIKKKREESLAAEYSNLVSGFLVLTGAGYSIKQAWKRLAAGPPGGGKKELLPVYREMQITFHQMEAGMPERQAYAEFGRRCGSRSYMKFASLLEISLSSGGKNLKKLLESEMEEAFKQRADIARRRGEEASTKLLIPMFGILGVVMVIVVAPAFLSLG